jgi:hypothetical protein
MFNNLVEEGEKLSVMMDEVTRLQSIQAKMRNWKTEVARVLDGLWNNDVDTADEETEKSNAKTLFDLYLESFWLPTLHLETDMLKAFLSRHK